MEHLADRDTESHVIKFKPGEQFVQFVGLSFEKHDARITVLIYLKG